MDINALWKPEYSVGNEKIDGQHRYLFELWLMLDSIKKESCNHRSLHQALISLLDYAVIHFEDEEAMLASHPDIDAHREIHRRFIGEAKSFMEAFQAGRLEIGEVTKFVRNWLVEHIVETDRRYFREIS